MDALRVWFVESLPFYQDGEVPFQFLVEGVMLALEINDAEARKLANQWLAEARREERLQAAADDVRVRVLNFEFQGCGSALRVALLTFGARRRGVGVAVRVLGHRHVNDTLRSPVGIVWVNV